jgi:UDP:flavonoid glycosyltransferase YjiC (YdhE family)
MGWTPLAGRAGAWRDAVGALVFRWMYERPLLPRLNDVRRSLGVGAVGSLNDLLEHAIRILVLTTPEFDFSSSLPEKVEYIGPQLESPEWTPPWEPPWRPEDDRPPVVVGLTTTDQAHGPLLNRIVSALGTLPVRALVTTGRLRVDAPPPNVHVAPYVSHARALSHAAAVVTHAGLGTVHAALTQGVPMVCLPIGRDQPDNAARVQWRGAGLRLPPTSSAATIAAAVGRIVHDEAYAAAARRLAEAIRDGRPERAGPDALERLVVAR